MSEGTPEPFEGGSKRLPAWLVALALGYTVAWILGAFTSLFFDWTHLREHRWIVWTSIALLTLSILILAREMGFIGGTHSGDGRS